MTLESFKIVPNVLLGCLIAFEEINILFVFHETHKITQIVDFVRSDRAVFIATSYANVQMGSAMA